MSQTPLVEVANQLRVERDIAIDQRDRARAENRELRDEVVTLREQLEASEATLSDEEAGHAETLDLWEFQKAEVARLKAAVQTHHDQRGDNRCHLDDLKLYFDVLGEGIDPYVGALPPDDDMAESCRRYIEQRRCPGPQGVIPLPGGMTIQQLTAEATKLRRACEGLLKHAASKPYWERQSVDHWDKPGPHNAAIKAIKAIAFAEGALKPATAGEGGGAR